MNNQFEDIIHQLAFIIICLYHQVIEKYWGGGLLGCDHHGRPVWLDMYGRRDIKGKKNADSIKKKLPVS